MRSPTLSYKMLRVYHTRQLRKCVQSKIMTNMLEQKPLKTLREAKMVAQRLLPVNEWVDE